MERLREKITTAETALQRLEEILVIEELSAIERDAAIQRFEFTFEILWKCAKDYLYKVEGLEIASPKGVIRSCREVKLFNEEETIKALQMADDRNLTVHTYNETLAIKICLRIREYAPLMKKWLNSIRKKVNAITA